MKKILEFLLSQSLRLAFWFRYHVEVKGLEKLNSTHLNKKGGVLFLPNHPTVFVDATMTVIALWPKFSIRPLIVEYMYFLPIVNTVMRFLDAIPVPNFTETSNSFKKRKTEKALQEVIKGLQKGQNFLIFPAGHVKHTQYEAVNGSAVHKILQDNPETNVVLVRIKGLYGSSFSRALTGQTPAMFPTIFKNMKHIFKNLLFFTPRRKVIIEFEPAPSDFPYKASRLEFNQYLERFYNQPDDFTPQHGKYPGDSLVLVSYSMWGEEIPDIKKKETSIEEIDVSHIPVPIQEKVLHKLAELTGNDPENIKPEMALSADLGLDSLDIADIIAFLQDEYDLRSISPNDLTTVAKFMALAAKQVEGQDVVEEEQIDISKWNAPRAHNRVQIPEGDTIPEVFLRICDQMGTQIACADMRSGVVRYDQLKMRVIILAEFLKKQPGNYIGILLPASVGATMCILACQLAGKIPLMVNWTAGSRHLQAIAQLSNVQVVLTSWAFLDRLQNVDLTGIEEQIVMLEDIRQQISLKDKIQGYLLSKCPRQFILKHFQTEKLSKNSEAVLLFTSGTESLPKGVPLTYENILSNQRAALQEIEVFSDDIIFGILPPFHSFGFTITSLIPILAGVRVAFSPDPTDGRKLAQAFSHWGVTIMCGAPTFIKSMLSNSTAESLKTMRLCITGAEKMPQDLIHSIESLGLSRSLLEGYGITECSPILTFTPLGKPRVGVGQPLPGIELCIVDLNTHKTLPTNSQGLILARGPNVFSGYLNPGLASPFINVDGKEWYNTGDLGSLDENGNLILSGRLKRFVKAGGEMVSLASIEDALLKIALQKKWSYPEEGPILAVSGKEIPGEKPKINLFTKFPISLDEVNKALRESGFSNLVKVTAIKQIPEIPVMGTGKIHYRKLDEIE